MDHAITLGDVAIFVGAGIGILIVVGLALFALSVIAGGYDH